MPDLRANDHRARDAQPHEAPAAFKGSPGHRPLHTRDVLRLQRQVGNRGVVQMLAVSTGTANRRLAPLPTSDRRANRIPRLDAPPTPDRDPSPVTNEAAERGRGASSVTVQRRPTEHAGTADGRAHLGRTSEPAHLQRCGPTQCDCEPEERRAKDGSALVPGSNLQRNLADIVGQRVGDHMAGEVSPGSRRTLYQGMSGTDVADAQTKLNAADADPVLELDGLFGPLTRQEVIDFQRANDLQVDGIVGPQTWGHLDRGVSNECRDESTPDDIVVAADVVQRQDAGSCPTPINTKKPRPTHFCKGRCKEGDLDPPKQRPDPLPFKVGDIVKPKSGCAPTTGEYCLPEWGVYWILGIEKATAKDDTPTAWLTLHSCAAGASLKRKVQYFHMAHHDDPDMECLGGTIIGEPPKTREEEMDELRDLIKDSSGSQRRKRLLCLVDMLEAGGDMKYYKGKESSYTDVVRGCMDKEDVDFSKITGDAGASLLYYKAMYDGGTWDKGYTGLMVRELDKHFTLSIAEAQENHLKNKSGQGTDFFKLDCPATEYIYNDISNRQRDPNSAYYCYGHGEPS